MHTLRSVIAVVAAAFSLVAISAGIVFAGPLERAVVIDTAYDVPPHAIFVAPQGRDTNDGTRRFPLRTVSAAIRAASDADTIVVRAGTYREALPTLSKRVTLQPFPGEKVWLKGSVVITEWVRDGDAWRHDNWTTGFCGNCHDRAMIDAGHPYARLPDQVFMDGVPLRQVATREGVTRETFYVDGETKRLYIGSNPVGRTVEATVHKSALTILRQGRGTVVRGIGFAHYAPGAEPGLDAMVKGDAADLVFENNTFAWSAVNGLAIYGANAAVRGNTFLYNGMTGLAAWKADGLTVSRNRFAFNNFEGFAVTGEVAAAAGAKLVKSRALSVTDNRFDDNRATGLWLDIDVSNATIVRNLVRGNSRHGIYVELSSDTIVASNIVTGNGVSGIGLADATDVRVYNNTLVDNAISLLVQDDDRVNGDLDALRRGNTWVTAGNVFVNNLVAVNAVPARAFVWARDFTGARRADDMIAGAYRNGYYRRDRSNPAHVAEWWRGRNKSLFADLASFRAATAREGDSIEIAGDGGDPFFVDAGRGDFALRPGSPARDAGRVLPPDVAAAIGVAGRTSPDLGALLGPGRRPVTPDRAATR